MYDLEKAVQDAVVQSLGPNRTKPLVVTLCGSTRFMKEFFDAGWQLTLSGVIVLSVGVVTTDEQADEDGAHAAEELGDSMKHKLDVLHFRKIDLSDFVFVLNIDYYIGESTAREIVYAESRGLPVFYLES